MGQATDGHQVQRINQTHMAPAVRLSPKTGPQLQHGTKRAPLATWLSCEDHCVGVAALDSCGYPSQHAATRDRHDHSVQIAMGLLHQLQPQSPLHSNVDRL